MSAASFSPAWCSARPAMAPRAALSSPLWAAAAWSMRPGAVIPATSNRWRQTVSPSESSMVEARVVARVHEVALPVSGCGSL